MAKELPPLSEFLKDAADAAAVFVAGSDGKMHHVGEANDQIQAIVDMYNDAFAKPIEPPRTQAPEVKPQLQHIYERLTELSQEMPPDAPSLAAQAQWITSSTLTPTMYNEYKQHLSINGYVIDHKFIEKIEQEQLPHGVSWKVKLTPAGYDHLAPFFKKSKEPHP